MTEKQKRICYFRLQGYGPRHCSLIAGTSDSYARRVINSVEEVDLQGYTPPIECMIRRKLLHHIMDGAGLIYVPNTQKYAYISLLGYLGFDYHQLHHLYPEDQGQFIYMALHRSNKAWRDLDSEFMGVSQEDYDDLMQIRRSSRKTKNCKKS